MNLIAHAPTTPDRPENEGTDQARSTNRSRDGHPFNYIPDEEVFALELDPRRVRFGLLEGWDREDDAFQDISALAYVSGPMYEHHVATDQLTTFINFHLIWTNGQDITSHLRSNSASL